MYPHGSETQHLPAVHAYVIHCKVHCGRTLYASSLSWTQKKKQKSIRNESGARAAYPSVGACQCGMGACVSSDEKDKDKDKAPPPPQLGELVLEDDGQVYTECTARAEN